MAFPVRANTTARSMAPLLAGFVLEGFADLEGPPEGQRKEWALVPCSARKAYGCGEHGQKVVGGLTVYARLVTSPDPTSALCIEANDDALRGIKAEFGCVCRTEGPHILEDKIHCFHAVASVHRTDERFIFLTLRFVLSCYGEREYYLIYDSVDASLSMIPLLPSHCPIGYAVSPLPVPLGGVSGRYELLLLASRPLPPRPGRLERRKEDVVCVCTSSAAAVEDNSPWKMLPRLFPEELIQHPLPFDASLMFAFGGKAYWVDLRKGIVHCDWPPADGVEAVEFGFIDLPPGCPRDLRWNKPEELEESDFVPLAIDRTAACVNGRTIRFVFIDRSCPGGSGNVVVHVWDLDPATRIWNNLKNFLAKELWQLWSFKKGGLPRMEPRFPVLMADGTLCLLMPKSRHDPTLGAYICNVELSNLTVLWSACLQKYHAHEEPVILPSRFFGMLKPLDPQKKMLRGIFTQK